MTRRVGEARWLTVLCPTCRAAIGEPCARPTWVRTAHLTRQDRAARIWNRAEADRAEADRPWLAAELAKSPDLRNWAVTP